MGIGVGNSLNESTQIRGNLSGSSRWQSLAKPTTEGIETKRVGPTGSCAHGQEIVQTPNSHELAVKTVAGMKRQVRGSNPLGDAILNSRIPVLSVNSDPPAFIDLLDLTGRVVLVTGATGGLGSHFAHVLDKAGATVAIAGRNRRKLGHATSGLSNRTLSVELDVQSNPSISDAIESVVNTLGPIDILVNNAGITHSARFIGIEKQAWSEIMETNLHGMFRLSQLVSRYMLENQRSGCILNIASILGMQPGFGQTAYSVSKAGVIQLTRSMALELGPKGIRVNALCPGYFKTDMNREYLDSDAGIAYIEKTPAGRTGQMHELDIPLLMLVSDAGNFINGAVIPVDGGHLVQSL